MNKIDFEKDNPYYVNGDFKWYVDKYFQDYIENKQAENLPRLKGFGCFVVKNNDTEDYVLIDNKQNIIDACKYNYEGFEHMQAKINIIKISQHFEEYENNNV